MSFQPIVPLGGLAGWEFLKRTRERQENSFTASPRMSRLTRGFAQDFAKLRSAEDLVGNRQALDVVLGAYGLQADLENRAFIKKVITDGATDPRALSNRLADKRYNALARDMAHLAPGGTGQAPQDLAEQLLGRFRTMAFEVAVGDSNESMRLGLAFERKLPEIAAASQSDAAQWFSVLGDLPTRRVIETALGLPKEFASLDIEEQAERLRAAARKRFGTDAMTELAKPEMIAQITQRFLLMEQVKASQTGMSGAAIALSLLSRAG
ncbi:DUF1217 domain-containing protein [Roseibaca sp. V10]|uniref:DUF1217 domain-containing protein n=1 Tax=Roseinatronobacter domitianus TaxID=2940293 RepID=A0ABT0M0B2_9RHOB|nr:DUF1217 domain-containing protein [Roseibaca domitiana]